MKSNRTLLIISILCIAAGLLLTWFSGVRDGGYLKQLLGDAGSARIQEKKTVEVTEDFHSLRVKEFSADVQLLPSEDGGCRVVYGEDENSRCEVSVENGVLTVERVAEKNARTGFIIFEETLPVCIYLPAGSYKALSASCTSGDVISSGDFSWDAAEVETGSGSIRLENLSAKELRLKSTSGDIKLEGLRADALSAESGSGDIKLRGCSAAAVQVHSTSGRQKADSLKCSGDGAFHSGSGHIELEDSSFRALRVSATSGDVSLDQVSSSAETEVETGSGSIRLHKAAAESFDLHTTSGDVKGSIKGSVDFITETGSGSIHTSGGVRGAAECRVKTGSGDVDLEADR